MSFLFGALSSSSSSSSSSSAPLPPSSSHARKLVESACQELLIEPDLTINLSIVDWISSSSLEASKIINCIRHKLCHSDHNVCFLALSLLDMLVKNCDTFVLQLIQNSSCMDDVVVASQRIEQRTRQKALECINEWAQSFKERHDLPGFGRTHRTLISQGVKFSSLSTRNQSHRNSSFTTQSRHHSIGDPVSSISPLNSLSFMSDEYINKIKSDFTKSFEFVEQTRICLQQFHTNDASNNSMAVSLVSVLRDIQTRVLRILMEVDHCAIVNAALLLNDSLQSMLTLHTSLTQPNDTSSIKSAAFVLDDALQLVNAIGVDETHVELCALEPPAHNPKQVMGDDNGTEMFASIARRPTLSASSPLANTSTTTPSVNDDDMFASIARRHSSHLTAATSEDKQSATVNPVVGLSELSLTNARDTSSATATALTLDPITIDIVENETSANNASTTQEKNTSASNKFVDPFEGLD